MLGGYGLGLGYNAPS